MRVLLVLVARPGRSGCPRPPALTLIETVLGLLGVLLIIVATAVFVAAEFALVAADRDRLEAEGRAGSRAARTALALQRRLSFHLSGAQLGITLASLVLGFIAEPTIGALIEPASSPCSERIQPAASPSRWRSPLRPSPRWSSVS